MGAQHRQSLQSGASFLYFKIIQGVFRDRTNAPTNYRVIINDQNAGHECTVAGEGWASMRTRTVVPLPGITVDTDLTAENVSALVHTHQAERMMIVDIGCGNAPAIILHDQRHPAIGVGKVNLDFAGVGVAGDIVEGFLEDAE